MDAGINAAGQTQPNGGGGSAQPGGAERADVLNEAARLAAGDTQGAPDDAQRRLRFLERYHQHAPTEDVVTRRPEDILRSAAAHRDMARTRTPGSAVVAVRPAAATQGDAWTQDALTADATQEGEQQPVESVFSGRAPSDGHAGSAASTGRLDRRAVLDIVTDDMPFLVDSVAAELAHQDCAVHLLLHPQLVVRRTAEGELVEILDRDVADRAATDLGDHEGVSVESWIHVEFDPGAGTPDAGELENRIRAVLGDVAVAVHDWPAMTEQARDIARGLQEQPPTGIDPAEVEQVTSLLRWLADGQFTFLGYREYRLLPPDENGSPGLQAVAGSGLGLLRDRNQDTENEAGGTAPRITRLTGAAARKATEAGLIILTKANARSTVHRPVHLDYVGIKTFAPDGTVVGERRFLGLFTSNAYTWSVTSVPFLQQKVTQVLERSGFDPLSHNGKDLLGVLETYPRDELFQTDVVHLTEVAQAVVHLQERRRTKLFTRRDTYGRFISALVYLPRDRFTTAVRTKVESILREAFHGDSVDYTTRVTESSLARLHYLIRVSPGTTLPEVDEAELEARIVAATRTWEEDLAEAARGALGDESAAGFLAGLAPTGGAASLARAFPEAYKEDVSARYAVQDLRQLHQLSGGVALNLYTPGDAGPGERRLKLYSDRAVSLSALLPIFSHLGLEVTDERPYELHLATGTHHIYDVGLSLAVGARWEGEDEAATRARFQEAFLAVWHGEAESDGLNALVLAAGLTWRDVAVLRCIARYLRQTGIPFSNDYIVGALLNNPALAAGLVSYFALRLDPAAFPGEVDGLPSDERQRAEQEALTRLEADLDTVASLDQDRILRTFLSVIGATLRTNHYQQGSQAEHRPTLALKLDPQSIPHLPAPRPVYEIWVYSPRVEGVHLRFGPVARGGLRWSDRREDFRTEILGLVKAQVVKNAVIVPTGSKGGFFAKQLPDPSVERDAWLAEGVASYRLFIGSLLDLTDNLVDGDVVPPPGVVRHDGDDTYLVVAADKGTATFSDTANEVAASYGFWLDDAFASGGSAGYDHKAMGITARGAWESVKRHFTELGVDTQSEDFTAVGIGDMSGDVFGNGMLLSEHIRLVAAFDHRHIFLDPTPDAASSYAERRRLFELPRSSWADYDSSLISTGGGVHPRTSKSVPITPQVRAALGLPEDGPSSLPPTELIRAVLTAPVDLLWNGGIGTYVKAASESHSQIGDRANDPIRINGNQLRVKVVGEGGNLGFSQLGRIEAALHGVAINTDAIDNSAGVDTSDHEVNIKIMLGALIRSGDLAEADRNDFLAAMTDDVAAHVLRDNYEQNVLLANARVQDTVMAPVHERLMSALSERGLLDRELEFLPDTSAFAARLETGRGLTSPEFSVLVAYSKLALKEDLIAGGIADDPWFEAALRDYFPEALSNRFAQRLGEHPLRRQIIVNSVANSVVNRGGITFVHRTVEETGASVEEVVRAFVVAREIFGLRSYVEAVEALDHVVAPEVQARLYLEFRRLMDRAVRWFVQNSPRRDGVSAEIERYTPAAQQLLDRIPALLRGSERARLDARAAQLVEDGVPENLAHRVAGLLDQFSMLDIAELARRRGEDPLRVAEVYFAVSERLGMDQLLYRVSALPRASRWEALARAALRDDLYGVLDALTEAVLDAGIADSAATDSDAAGSGSTGFGSADSGDAAGRTAADQDPAGELVERWIAANAASVERVGGMLGQLAQLEDVGIAPLSVTLRTLRGLLRSADSR